MKGKRNLANNAASLFFVFCMFTQSCTYSVCASPIDLDDKNYNDTKVSDANKFEVSAPNDWASKYTYISEQLNLTLTEDNMPISYTKILTRNEFAKIAVNVYELLWPDTDVPNNFLEEVNKTYGDARVSIDMPIESYKAIFYNIMASNKEEVINGKAFKIFNGSENITREQAIIPYSRILRKYDEFKNYKVDTNTILNKYSDVDHISVEAREAVALMTELGVVNGSNGKFNPAEYCSYEDSLLMAVRTLEIIEKNNLSTQKISDIEICTLDAPKLEGFDNSIATVTKDGVFTVKWSDVEGADSFVVDIAGKSGSFPDDGVFFRLNSEGQKTVTLNLNKNNYSLIRVRAVDEKGLVSSNYSEVKAKPYLDDVKSKAANGGYKNPNVKVIKFQSPQEALPYMREISFKVWNINKTGQKISSDKTIMVNKDVTEEVLAIFDEIYNGPEKFPIYSVSGYSWRGLGGAGAHNMGLAIDINPNENYYFNSRGERTGSFWDPSRSVYSIPSNGDVVNAFRRYGWFWAGVGWGSTYDYMHFSYTGT